MPTARVATYVIPGLVWPNEGARQLLEKIELPALAALFGAARVSRQPAVSFEPWLADQFSIEKTSALAQVRLRGEQSFLGQAPNATAHRHWLCADPASLRFAREHLLLSPGVSLRITQAESADIVAGLNDSFGDIGRFYAATPERWYLGFDGDLDVRLAPLADVAGRPIAFFQPEGPNKSFWVRLSNELQVFCHNHPVNIAREERGEPPINAIWLWGAGTSTCAAKAPAASLSGDHVLLRGLADFARASATAFEALAPAEWNLLDDLLQPAAERDWENWQQALQRLDSEVLAPAWRAVKQGELKQLRIRAPGDACLLHIDVCRPAPWRFWRRDATTQEVAQHLAHTPA